MTANLLRGFKAYGLVAARGFDRIAEPTVMLALSDADGETGGYISLTPDAARALSVALAGFAEAGPPPANYRPFALRPGHSGVR